MQTKQKSQAFRTLDIAYIGIFTALIALCSWVSIPTTVPFTLQTLAIFLTLCLAGGRNGFFAVLTYLLLGAAGVPVFAGFKGGLGALFGNTGGYLLGFLLLAVLYRVFTAAFGETLPIKALGLSAGLLVCYTFGTVWFLLLYTKTGGSVSFLTVLGWCVFPFLLPDAAKLAVALLLSEKLQKHIKKQL